jgi:hypothetical protein
MHPSLESGFTLYRRLLSALDDADTAHELKFQFEAGKERKGKRSASGAVAFGGGIDIGG